MSRKIKSINFIDTLGETMMLQFKFTGHRESSQRLLGSDYCDRARLIYKNDARGIGGEPYYKLKTVIDTGKGQPMTITKETWHEDEPLVVPMKYIHDNLV